MPDEDENGEQIVEEDVLRLGAVGGDQKCYVQVGAQPASSELVSQLIIAAWSRGHSVAASRGCGRVVAAVARPRPRSRGASRRGWCVPRDARELGSFPPSPSVVVSATLWFVLRHARAGPAGGVERRCSRRNSMRGGATAVGFGGGPASPPVKTAYRECANRTER